MWPNPSFLADLVTFTEEILNGELLLLLSDSSIIAVPEIWFISSQSEVLSEMSALNTSGYSPEEFFMLNLFKDRLNHSIFLWNFAKYTKWISREHSRKTFKLLMIYNVHKTYKFIKQISFIKLATRKAALI